LGPPVGEGLRKRKRHTQWCCGKVDNFCTVSLSLLVLLQECHCMLFLTDDNDFAGKDQEITIDEIREGVNGM
jgi:ferredoxin-thioredoxin reductase catalytic subunit